MRIAFLLVKHPPERKSPIVPLVIERLRAMGHVVTLLHPEEVATDLGRLRVEHDLYVLKSGSELALSLAGALHALGATILNPYPAAAALRDKVVATRLLIEAGVPVPASFTAGRLPLLEEALVDGALVVKPWRGSQGRGVRVARSAAELGDDGGDRGLAFAQRLHAGDGRDRKIYCASGRCFGVKRIWPPRTFEDKLGEPFEVGPELEEIALRCGEALGVELFGLDVVVSDDRPWVVDMQSFPGFKGVPEADRVLADAIDAAARRSGGAPARPRPPGAPRLDAELALAVRLAREAGEVLRRRRGPGLEIGAKAGGEIVTAADVEANERIRAALAQAYPHDGLFLEESPDSPARLGRRRVWIVDPLDATSDYAGGGDQHAVSIGLAVGGERVLGVVYNPARDELVAGYRGAGVTLNGTPVRASAREALRGARLTASPKEWRRSSGAGAVAGLPVHPVSSMAYKLARVAAGLSDGAFSTAPRKEWGTCAGVALVLAAGGRATLLDGSPIRFNRGEARQPLGMAASGRRLHAPLLAALAALADEAAVS